jgi:KUP system potassium uptake protein
MLVLGGVFLCVTGAEALYADLGHFGRAPIRRGWCVVFPALVLNYAGQAAIVLAGKPAEGSVFSRLCPAPLLLLPLVILATLATAVASQAVITGTFSMTRQAIQLGWLPQLRIVQTSAAGYGQIYVPAVNWLLMTGTLALAIGFGSSDSLAAAYGNCGVGDNAGNHHAPVHCHARGLELAIVEDAHSRRCFWHR